MKPLALPALTLLLSSMLAAAPSITPPPRHAEWNPQPVPLARLRTVSSDAPEIARLLVAECARLHAHKLAAAPSGDIRLLLDTTPAGKKALAAAAQGALYKEHAGAETYLLDASPAGVTIVASTARGLLYGVQTLLQMVEKGGVASGRIVDYPQLAFRGVHICIFPNTELENVRQAMLVAARFKYNAIVIEPWASLASPSHPETAWETAYTARQLKDIVELGKALQMEMIPMLNSWGHASGMRSRASVHVVLDRFPQFKPLYEEDGWSFCLTNPGIYKQLFDRYEELLKLFDNPRYFHIGLDEAWGHIGLKDSPKCRGENPRETLAAHLKKLHAYFAQRNVRIFVWHDMFIQRDHPQLGRLSPANSYPPYNTHLVLDQLPRDIIMDAWNYDATGEWPVTKHFQDRGFPVVVSPWKSRKNVVSLLNTAKRLNAMGLLETTWDSLDVTLPTVGEAGVMAWTAPGFDLNAVPFENYLRAIRQYPLANLPRFTTSNSR